MDYDRTSSLNQIADLLNKAIETNPRIVILLETMAGKGSEVGKTFQEIAYLISLINRKESIGVCLDTCHINDGGYDLSNVDALLSEFDEVIGLKYLHVCHVNDSKNSIGAHKDRHENFGFGHIGFDKLINFIYHPLLNGKIFILETPYVKKNEKDKSNAEMLGYTVKVLWNPEENI